MAGLDVIQDCFTTFRTHYGERLAAPAARTELVNAGHNGVKRGGGFVIPEGDPAALIACRTAYAKLGQLVRELGSAPL